MHRTNLRASRNYTSCKRRRNTIARFPDRLVYFCLSSLSLFPLSLSVRLSICLSLRLFVSLSFLVSYIHKHVPIFLFSFSPYSIKGLAKVSFSSSLLSLSFLLSPAFSLPPHSYLHERIHFTSTTWERSGLGRVFRSTRDRRTLLRLVTSTFNETGLRTLLSRPALDKIYS